VSLRFALFRLLSGIMALGSIIHVVPFDRWCEDRQIAALSSSAAFIPSHANARTRARDVVLIIYWNRRGSKCRAAQLQRKSGPTAPWNIWPCELHETSDPRQRATRRYEISRRRYGCALPCWYSRGIEYLEHVSCCKMLLSLSLLFSLRIRMRKT
jgi:hypothetical protein